VTDPETLRTWRLKGLSRALEESDETLRARACARAGLPIEALRGFRIARQSLDARRGREQIHFVCQVDLIVPAGLETRAMRRLKKCGKLAPAPRPASLRVDPVAPSAARSRVAVVGAGPGGLFAALILAENGVQVTLLERGDAIRERGRKLAAFHRRRRHDRDSNLLFGEGGAGTYSDGKLYTRVDDPLEVLLLEELVAAGADADILYDARAHIGTDRLHRVIPELRRRLEARGVRFEFGTRLERFSIDEGPPRRIRSLITSAGELPCDALLLSIGHSARDTWSALARQGVQFESKPFQFGVRVEHPQALIDRARFGSGRERLLLGAASYNLICKPKGDGPGAHSFCMCPGGRVVASISEAGELCTNGMSNSRHSSRYANAAIVTTLRPEEFAPYGSGPFAGVEFQRHFERLCFEAGGGDYTAPAQRVPDFLAGRLSSGALESSYLLGTVAYRIDQLLPERVATALAAALTRFERQIEGFSGPDGLLIGIESRSSGPVRMPRDPETRRALGFTNLFPAGEGAGYAGGIMSAAIDGARSAQALLRFGVL